MADYDEENNVGSCGNVVYFHAPVSRRTVYLLCKELDEVVKSKVSRKLGYIKLYIHTEGGCLHSGLSAMHHIDKCALPITTIVDGLVASAGTFLLLGGKKRYMQRYSTVLIHQIRTVVFGKYEDIVQETANCTRLMKMMRSIYTEKTSIPPDILDQILSKEKELSSDECLRYNIVTRIK
jgi:ATP-dependent protease ClpP protease subunit